jgi:hypothetical protein
MDAHKSNKLTMYRSSLALLKSPEAPIGGIPALPGKLTALTNKVAEITALSATQSQPTKGAVTNRDQLIEDTAHAALVIAGAVLSYADEKKLPELAAKVRIKRSDFTQGRKEAAIQLAQQVHEAATVVVGDLADYGVNGAALTDLQSRIATTTEALSRPRSTVTAKKAATGQLPVAFKEADALLENQIDPLLVPLRKTHPEFYAEYKAARIIVDRRGGRDAAAAPAKSAPSAGPSAT